MKKALIVIDFQNDFIDGVLGSAEALSVKNDVLALLKNFEGDLIFTLDTHDENYFNTKEGLNLKIKHCIKGSKGWQMPDEFQPFLAKALRIFEKNTFGSLDLADFLRTQNYDELHFCGLISHICVFHNIILAFNASLNTKLIFHSKASASINEDLEDAHKKLLESFWVEII